MFVLFCFVLKNFFIVSLKRVSSISCSFLGLIAVNGVQRKLAEAEQKDVIALVPVVKALRENLLSFQQQG